MKPAKNALKGYSYQKSIYTYFLLKMDLERTISSVQAEIDINGHNFDDVFVNENGILYYVQTKNYDNVTKLEITDTGIKSNGDFSKRSDKGINVFVLKNAPKDILEINANIFGLEAHFEKNIYIICADLDALFEDLSEKYNNNSRFCQMLVFSEKMASSRNNYVALEDLPEYKFFSNELMEKTINIRNFKINDEYGIKFIIGKPGVGKSHLVNEIKNENSILYRFWISEQDESKLERLHYKNFIQELSILIFNNFKKYSEEEIIQKLADDEKMLIIDGLDHVENYNPSEIELYINFLNKLGQVDNVKVLVLSRPLRTLLKWDCLNLENWTKDETMEYIKYKYEVEKYEVVDKIFEITDGYPIITDFLIQHYVYYKEIPELTKINNINEYYDKLINNEEIKNKLSIFSLTDSYITYYEIDKIFTTIESGFIKSFINEHKYLFEIRLNRIALIHDSLKTYLIQNTKNLKEIKDKISLFVTNSIEKEELRFLARIDKFEISDEYKKQILIKYSNFEMFNKLCEKNIDIEGVFDFYFKLKEILINCNANILNIYQYYEFILILTIIKRDHLSFSNALMYEQLRYYKKNKINIQDNIYSSGNLYYLYYTLKTRNILLYKKRMIDKNYDGENFVNGLYEDIKNEKCFFDENKEFDNIEKYEEEYILNDKIPSYERMKKYSILLSNIFINKIEYKEYSEIINEYIYANNSKSLYRVEEFFKRIGIEIFMAKWALNYAREEIYSRGLCKEINPYLNLTLEEFINENSFRGSFSLRNHITAYLRLAIKEKRIIDINSINQFYCMYYNRKDYSVYTLPIILKILVDKKIMEIKEAVEIINNAQEMSEKGIRHILCEFINMLDDDEISYLMTNTNVFIRDSQYHFYLHGLNSNVINILSEEYVTYEIISELNRHSRSKSIDFDDIKNYLTSKYENFILEFIKRWNLEIYNVPKKYKFKDNNLIVRYKEDDSKYVMGEAFEKGYLMEEDFEYIKAKNISHIELSKYLDGWYSKFPFVSLYEMYNKEMLRNNILTIIYTTLKYGKESLKYDGDYNHYLGNIPQFLVNIEFDTNWNKINSILNDFLKVSKII